MNINEVIVNSLLDFKKVNRLPDGKCMNIMLQAVGNDILTCHNEIVKEKDDIIVKLQAQIKKERGE